MKSHYLTLLGYLCFVAIGVALELRSRAPQSRIPSIGHAISRVMRTRSGRVGLFAGWAWLGVHFFAR